MGANDQRDAIIRAGVPYVPYQPKTIESIHTTKDFLSATVAQYLAVALSLAREPSLWK